MFNILFCKPLQAYDEIGPIMSQLFYIEGKNDIPNVLNYTGPFGSKRELVCTLIRKEKQFFTIYGVKKLVEEFNYVRQGQMQKCDWKIIHGDFDEQNILVVFVYRDPLGYMQVSFLDMRTRGSIPHNDAEVEKNRKKKELRDYFHQEMVAKFGVGDISGQILDRREQDEIIVDLEDMFTRMVHRFDSLENLLVCYFDNYYKAYFKKEDNTEFRKYLIKLL
ncbi:hypothetical protein RirG_092170 [Rhizophagus irregularis DAOM 197198w]|uniref:Uncharacterized protein n=2 Tax=Rhizophagus irregularis TaxID=588596 RepID=A0A015JRE5_RHIIW|nr:hypothetical protein RirG_092170 [Rhizophagus irregularis DAOM 197198w]